MDTHDTLTTQAHTIHTPSGGLFSVEPGLLIWTWVVFAVLALILRKFAWGPMMASVQEREGVLAKAVENARLTQQELERIAERQKVLIEEAQNTARSVMEQGRIAAEETMRQSAEKARLEAQQLSEQARDRIRIEEQEAINHIRREAVDLVIRSSEKLIRQSLDDETHRRLVQKQLEEL